jgi:hypothetical protein
MAFDVGKTALMSNGYGFSIRNTHKGPITSIVFATREAAEKAEAAIREAIKNALSVTDTNGQKW